MDNLAFYEHKDGTKPDVLDYQQELEIAVKEPMKLIHEMLTTMWERGELRDTPLVHSVTTTLWSCMLRWDALDSFFKKEYRGKSPADDFRTETRNVMENRACHELQWQFLQLPDKIKKSMSVFLLDKEEREAYAHLAELYLKKKYGTVEEPTEEALEFQEAQMAA